MLRGFLLFLLFIANLYSIEIGQKSEDLRILSNSKIWITTKAINISDVIKSNKFKDKKAEHINLGFSPKSIVWIKIKLRNISDKKLTKIIKVDNPLLEEVSFFESNDNFKPHVRGLLHVKENQKYLYPTYKLEIKAKSTTTIYIKVKNSTTGLQFGLSLLSKQSMDKQDTTEQLFIMFFIGILSAFFLYSMVLYLYTKDKSYFLYSVYLFFLMFQQLTFIGFLPLYAPKIFTYMDNLLVVPKVSLMIVVAALFAKNFLRTKDFKTINKIYDAFILFLLLQMPIFGTQWLYIPQVTILTGFLFVLFNTYCGFYVYFHGNKQARFFIVGWIFLIVGYLVMIFDSLGFVSVMYYFPELIMCLTALEALFLLLAFVDKINLLDIQKKELNEKLLQEMSHRQSLIQSKVKEKTIQLQTVVEEKTTLLRELHHRVKNNLQLILSIIRLQGFGIEDKYLLEQFKKLEYRIKAVAKTHEMLCSSDDISRVDMHEYIMQLCEEIQSGFFRDNIEIRYDIGLNLPLCKAVYIGLIVNELISNSIKHAFAKKGGEIIISLKQLDDNYVLKISDNGDGYKDSMTAKETLGLKLVDSLVSNQLDGKIELNTGNMFEHIVTFPKKVCK